MLEQILSSLRSISDIAMRISVTSGSMVSLVEAAFMSHFL